MVFFSCLFLRLFGRGSVLEGFVVLGFGAG